MPQSMTAFARCDSDTQWGTLSWELRSVNHRYLELSPRAPETLRALEPQVRELAGKRLGRGKVDMFLRFQPKELDAAEFELNGALVTRLLAVARQAGEVAGETASLRAIDILRWPGALKTPEVDYEALGQTTMALLSQALDELVAMRQREGQRLGELIVQRLASMRKVIASVRGFLPEVVQQFRQRLTERLSQVREELDPERIEQEIVLFAQKADIDEELDRLESHLEEVGRALARPGPIGRRLDFLMQELNREANTLASKAGDIRLTNGAVELKVLIEQVREQVQNIE